MKIQIRIDFNDAFQDAILASDYATAKLAEINPDAERLPDVALLQTPDIDALRQSWRDAADLLAARYAHHVTLHDADETRCILDLELSDHRPDTLDGTLNDAVRSFLAHAITSRWFELCNLAELAKGETEKQAGILPVIDRATYHKAPPSR